MLSHIPAEKRPSIDKNLPVAEIEKRVQEALKYNGNLLFEKDEEDTKEKQKFFKWGFYMVNPEKCGICDEENIKGCQYEDNICVKCSKIYEYDGDPWHGNPKLFNPQDINPISLIPYGKLYENTIKKKEYLINCGFHFIQIWGSMWKYKIKCIKIIQRWWRKNK